MEILSETTRDLEYLVIIGIWFFIALIGIAMISSSIIEGRFKSELLMGLIILSLSMFVLFRIKDIDNTEYKVIITDFNEVYNNGYEIVDKDGKIYTVRKSD